MKVLTLPINFDADVISARQKGRELLKQHGCNGSRLTLLSTVISEAARKIRAQDLPGEISISAARTGRVIAIKMSVRVHRADATHGVELSSAWERIEGLTEIRAVDKTVIEWTEEISCSDDDEIDAESATTISSAPGPPQF